VGWAGEPAQRRVIDNGAISQIHCKKASVSDDCGLIEMLSHNLDYVHTRARQYSEDYHSARARGITRIRSSQFGQEL